MGIKLSQVKNKDKILLLSEFYSVNWKKMHVSIPLYYDSAEEVVYNNGDDVERLELRPEILTRISDIMKCFPKQFTCDISLYIKDYSKYKPQAVMSAFTSEIELFYYKCSEDRIFSWKRAVIFLIVAALCLLTENIVSLVINPDNIMASPIVGSMFEVAAWVFAWAAIEFIFIFKWYISGISKRLPKQISLIKMVDSNTKKAICKINKKQITKSWYSETKTMKCGKVLLFVTSYISVFLAISYIGSVYLNMNDGDLFISSFIDINAGVSTVYPIFICILSLTYLSSLCRYKAHYVCFTIVLIIALYLLVTTSILMSSSNLEPYQDWMAWYIILISIVGITNYIGFVLECKDGGIMLELKKFKEKINF